LNYARAPALLFRSGGALVKAGPEQASATPECPGVAHSDPVAGENRGVRRPSRP